MSAQTSVSRREQWVLQTIARQRLLQRDVSVRHSVSGEGDRHTVSSLVQADFTDMFVINQETWPWCKQSEALTQPGGPLVQGKEKRARGVEWQTHQGSSFFLLLLISLVKPARPAMRKLHPSAATN